MEAGCGAGLSVSVIWLMGQMIGFKGPVQVGDMLRITWS